MVSRSTFFGVSQPATPVPMDHLPDLRYQKEKALCLKVASSGLAKALCPVSVRIDTALNSARGVASFMVDLRTRPVLFFVAEMLGRGLCQTQGELERESELEQRHR